eukprot:CAMPEP_0198289918 /NCGR_PEP_ID=MMETSP1449-20131203/7953_1 /TAXON_ID=420275 /ORGANISM="Attheya septentrionalis, Strain CCMP2084" /LENGTH=424 /DNA_ID=CAMNT_0043988323 /DNA_START=49 /DNA_END=1320 /DNA_ORIENTATION=+
MGPNDYSLGDGGLTEEHAEEESGARNDVDRLHRFVERMPKVELHAHLNGCVREETLLELAAERQWTLSSVLVTHHHNHNNSNNSFTNARSRSLSDCFKVFEDIGKCVDTLPTLRRIAQEALEDFAQHHVAYLELRSTPKCLWTDSSRLVQGTKRDYVETLLSVFSEYETNTTTQEAQPTVSSSDLNHHHNPDPNRDDITPTFQRLPLIPRLILSIDRSKSAQDAMDTAQLAVELFQCYPDYVVGVDLGGNPTKNDFCHFRAALNVAREAGLKITLHCGEIPCSEEGSEAFAEAKAMVDFAPHRLGHALLLPPLLRQQVMELKIPVECCPTSNVMTLELATHCDGNLIEGLQSHPQLAHWLDAQHPMSISTDDSGVFHTNPTRELLLLSESWNVTHTDLERIVLDSLHHSFDPHIPSMLKDSFLQ